VQRGEFTCNICGHANRLPSAPLPRETASCAGCGSTVRTRGLLQALSLELFGINLPITDFPRVKSLRGLGLSDSHDYAERLAGKFDYRNTYYSREPRLDITSPPPEEFGKYDFLLASEIFEHVPPPVELAFGNALRLLKPNGVLLLTVPYSLGSSTNEHYPELHQFALTQVGDRVLLVNRSAAGELRVFEDLLFHAGGTGPALEMRQFSEAALKEALRQAGFCEIRIRTGDFLPFGVVWAESWSLPVVARKAPFCLSADASRDLLGQWAALRKSFRELGGEFWVRLGFKLGRIDRRRYFIARGNLLQPTATESTDDEKQTK
jgi:SAM-dependent methyltransferase